MFSRISSLFAVGTPAKHKDVSNAKDCSPTLVNEDLGLLQPLNHDKGVTGVAQPKSRLLHRADNLPAYIQSGRETFTASRRSLHRPANLTNSASKGRKLDALIKHRGSMSPNTRVDYLLAKSGFQTPHAAGAKRKYSSHGVVASGGKKVKVILEEDEDDDLDGSTILVTNDAGDDYLSESEHQIQREASQAWDDYDETLIEEHESPDTQASSLSQQRVEAESEFHFVSIQQLLDLGWPADTTLLVQKLHHRGREPILTADWQMDFLSLPDELFSINQSQFDLESRRPFITSLGGLPNFHGAKALSSLFQMPSRARARVDNRLHPEILIESGVKKYISWAYSDARLAVPLHRRQQHSHEARKPQLPKLILTQTASRTEDPDALERVVLKRLTSLRQNWTTYLSSSALEGGNDVPTVYAVVISHTNAAIVAFCGHGLRQVGHFDLGDEGLDVWNGLALAALAVHGRNIARDYRSMD